MDDFSKSLGQTGAATQEGSTEPGSPDAATAAAALGPALQSTGGIDGLMDKLRGAGLGDKVDSWVSSGPNEPVEPAALGEALGPDTVNTLSSKTGLNVGQLLPLLAAFLPQLINMLTPNGQVPPGGLDQAAGSMPDIGGLLGGLLGGSSGSGAQGAGGLGDVLGGLGGMLGGDENR
jgi:uncharacterized protein YidB (DUF937 family)